MVVPPAQIQRLCAYLPRLAYCTTVAVFIWLIAGYHLPGQAFTALLILGDRAEAHAIPQLRNEQPYVYPESYGYDGQYYVQLAMQPNLKDPALQQAVDNLPFRARRILVSWISWALAGGDPGRALHIYSLFNVFCWLALAALLLRWFPPDGWSNYLRWAGVLFSFGLCYSIRGALLDGPSLLAIASVIALWESDRPWLAAVALGLAGLVRETNIVAAVVFLPICSSDWRKWRQAVLLGAVAVAPLALWGAYLIHLFGLQGQAGSGGFGWPFVEYVHSWQTVLANWCAFDSNVYEKNNLFTLLSLTAQAAFIACWFRPKDHWWRLGAVLLVLMAMLGEGVWQGYPISAARVLLPLILVFNVLIPRGVKWLPLLLLGNLTVLCALPVFNLTIQVERSFVFTGLAKVQPATLAIAPVWTVAFDVNWDAPQQSRWQYWRWSRGNARMSIVNPLPHAVMAEIRFGLQSRDSRTVTLSQGERQLWTGACSQQLQPVRLGPVRLEPGATVWRFQVDPLTPNRAYEGEYGVTFSLRDLEIELLGPAAAPAPLPAPGS